MIVSLWDCDDVFVRFLGFGVNILCYGYMYRVYRFDVLMGDHIMLVIGLGFSIQNFMDLERVVWYNLICIEDGKVCI